METMQELFYRDPYAREFSATVTACREGKKGFEVVLSDTAFYPEGGGQPSDEGTLGDAKVTFVKRIGSEVVHYTDKPLEVGSTVTGKLDWDRRFDNMQNHTCEHIFSGLVHQKYKFENVGFHMDPDDITVDFSGEIPMEAISELEKLVNQAITQNIDLKIEFPCEEVLQAMEYRSKKELHGVVRIVTVPGCDRCACCGTHVRHSGEIGMFKILDASKHRGGTRVRFVAGERARRDYDWRVKEIAKVSALFSAKPNEIAKAAENFIEEGKAKDQKTAQRTDRYLQFVAAGLKSENGVVTVFEEDLTPFELKHFVGMLKEKFPSDAVGVFSSIDGGFNYVIASSDPELTKISKSLNGQLNGRGGGRDGMVQGTYRADKSAVEGAFRETFSK